MKNNINISFNPRKYFKKLMLRKYMVVIPFILICAASVWLAMKQKPYFESSTTIHIDEPQFISRNLDRIALNATSNEEIDVLKRVLLGRQNLVELINKLNLKENNNLKGQTQAIQAQYPHLSFDEILENLLVENLREQISIKPSRNNFLTITAESDDQDKAYMLVKTMSELFMNQVIENDNDRINQLIDFNAQQLRIYEAKLKNSEEKLERYEQSLINVSNNGSAVSSRADLEKYNALLNSINEDSAQKRNELERLKLKLTKGNFEYFFPVSENLINLESQYRTLGQKILNEKIQAPVLVLNGNNEEVDILRRQISKEIRDIVSTSLNIEKDDIFRSVILAEMTKRDLDVLNNNKQRLINLINEHNSAIAQKPIQEATLTKYRNEVETNWDMYNTFLKHSQGSYIGEALQKREADYKFKIIEPATRPMERTNSRKKIVIIGGLLAMLVSLSIFSIAELLDNSFSEIEEIENYLQLSVLGAVPNIKFLNKSRTRVAVSAALVIVTIIISIILIKFCGANV